METLFRGTTFKTSAKVVSMKPTYRDLFKGPTFLLFPLFLPSSPTALPLKVCTTIKMHFTVPVAILGFSSLSMAAPTEGLNGRSDGDEIRDPDAWAACSIDDNHPLNMKSRTYPFHLTWKLTY
jgi:hypothetical protein